MADAKTGFACGERDATGVVQLRMNNVSGDRGLDFAVVRRVPCSTQQIVEYGLRPGDIVFNNTNSPALVGKTALFDGFPEPVVISNHFTRLRVRKELIDGRYLRHWMVREWRRGAFRALRTQWVNQASIRRERLLDLTVPLPTIEEQERVVAMLDQAEMIRRRHREAIRLIDEIRRSIFIELFGDPVVNPGRWPERPLEECGEVVSGVTKGRRLQRTDTRQVPYLRVANVQDGFLDLSDVQLIEILPEEMDRYRLLPGDMLLTEGGDPDKLGRGAVWEGAIELCVHQNHIFRVRVSRPDLRAEYLSGLIGSPLGKRYFLRAAKQTTGIATINSRQLKAFPVLMPPIELQRRYERAVAETRKLGASLDASSRRSEELLASLSERAFREGL